MLSSLTAFDTETRLWVPGLLAPPIVLGSFCEVEPGTERLRLGPDAVCSHLRELLAQERILVGANIAYDFGCVAAHDPSLLPLIVAAYEEGRVFDIQIAVSLMLIADGMLGRDPRDGGPLRSPSTGKHSDRVSLEIAVDLVLGRTDAKRHDYWRKRYAILERVPFDEWPQDARQYPLDDARNTLAVAVELLERSAAGRVRNLHNLKEQARAAFALQLASIWGLRTERAAIDALAAKAQADYDAAVARFTQSGLIRAEDGKQDGPTLKRLVAIAYGADPARACPRCGGSGKVTSPKSGKDIQCKASEGGCDATGLDLSAAPTLPRTDAGGISADRDTLKESGDDTLEAYGGVSEIRKILDTYIPYLRRGVDAPINPQANVLVASGRTSYDGLIQLMPRGHKVRDCFIPRPGWFFCSVDYNSLELCTLAQCCLWIVGRSEMAEAINQGRDLHLAFAASMLGISYQEAEKRKAAGDKQIADYRQAAKPCNFGFPGGMGVATFVQANRKVGIRFCQILAGAEVCGVEKINEYRGRSTPPLCKRCVELAEQLRSQWFHQWPEMSPYFHFVSTAVDAYGELTQFVSERIRGGLDFCNGANTLFQGLAADGAKHALWRVTKEAYTDPKSPLFGALRPVIFVHDEIFSEVRADVAHTASYRKTELMIAAMREYVPDVKIGAEPALMRRWYKEAKAAFDESGTLIPWEPKRKE